MPTQDDLSSLSSAALRAALVAAEEREKRERLEKREKEKCMERKKVRGQMRELQKRLDELEEGADTSEEEPERRVVGGSQRNGKRPRSDTPSDDEVVTVERHNRSWPIAKVRMVDPGPSRQRYVHPRNFKDFQ